MHDACGCTLRFGVMFNPSISNREATLQRLNSMRNFPMCEL